MTEKFIKIFAILSCLLSFAAIGNAQIIKHSEFEIPFEFVVGDRVFPAGEYNLQSANDHKTSWLIAGKSDKRIGAFLLANTIEDLNRISQAKLTFRQYGNRYFLAEFTLFDFRITLPKTKEEQFLQRESLASNKPDKTGIEMSKVIIQAK